MKPAIKKQWIAALLSGEYEQGRSQLRRSDDKFCCLGVLCNLHAQAHPRIAATQTSRTVYLGNDGLLPGEVIIWAGLSDSNPMLGSNPAAFLNDKGMPFERIAALIEKHL